MIEILVFGASGQLGSCLKKVAQERNITNISFPPEDMANILDVGKLTKLFENEKPVFVINCAAYTAVDKAEDDIKLCSQINKNGPRNLAKLCAKHNATLIQISTDFVFEGNNPFLLKEEDTANPIGIYGLTKLEGEMAIKAELDRCYILRTSWLYSEYGNNFVKTMLKLGAERDELNIITDQIGTPTYAIDLAGVIFDIIRLDNKSYGVYHYSNEGVASWYDFAQAIFNISNTTIRVNPIPTSAYPTRATRPVFSVMDKTKIKETFNVQVPYWRDSLVTCLERLSDMKI